MRRSLISFFFGDDVFISYSRSDGRSYAWHLAKLLGDARYDVFYDQLGSPRGQEVPPVVLRRCGRARLLVVVGTPMAKMSAAVRKEIDAFPCDDRGMVLIVFGEDGKSDDWGKLAPGVVRLTEPAGAFERSECSPDVVQQLRDAATFVRRRTVQFLASVIFAALIAASSLMALLETRQYSEVRLRLDAARGRLANTEKEVRQGQADLRDVRSRIVEARALEALGNSRVPGSEMQALKIALQISNDADALAGTQPPTIVRSTLAAAVVMAQRAITLNGSANFAESLTFSSDGKRLVAHSEFHDATAWAVGEDKDRNWHLEQLPIAERLTVSQLKVDNEAHQVPVQSTVKQQLTPDEGKDNGPPVWSFSADGDWALSPARMSNRVVRFDIWATGTGRNVASVASTVGFVEPPRFSDRGARLYYIDHGYRGHVLDLRAPDIKREVWVSPVERWGFKVSPSGSRVITQPGLLHSSDASRITCARVRSGLTVAPAMSNGSGARFLTDELVDLWTVEPESMRVWNCKTGEQTPIAAVPKVKSGFNEEERWYFVAGAYLGAVGHLTNEDQTLSDGYLTVWNLSDGQLRFRQQFRFDPQSLRSQQLIFAHHEAGAGIGDRIAAVWGGDPFIRLFDLSTGRLTNLLAGHHGVVLSVAASPDGQSLASTASDGEVRLWHLRDGIPLLRAGIPTRKTTDDILSYACMEPHGERLAMVGQAGLEFRMVDGSGPVRTVPFYSFLSQSELRDLSEGEFPFLLCSAHGIDVGLRTRRLSFSGDFISPSSQRESEWPSELLTDGNSKVQMKSQHPPEIVSTNRQGKQVFKWRLEKGDELHAPVAISNKRDRLAVATSAGSVHILDAKSLQEIIPAIETTDSVEYVEFSPDGQWIITVEDNERHRGGVKVWDVASGRFLFDVTAYGTSVTQATFSKDGTAIVYLCADGEVRRIWVDLQRLKSSATAMLGQWTHGSN